MTTCEPPAADDRRPDSPARRIDAACDRFEAAWRGGQDPQIEDFLEAAAEPERPALLRALIVLEVELRRGRGEQAAPGEYRHRFPGQTAVVAAAFAETALGPGDRRTRPSQSRVDTSRSLLFGLLALQNNFIDRDALLAAFNSWVADRSRSLGQILLERGALSRSRHMLLEALVEEHIRLHGDDPKKSLAALSSIGSVRDDLSRIADADLQASLSHVSAARTDNSDDPYRTVATSSVGDSTSAGTRFRILRPHAKGGLGEVFVALDTELNREVALKEIRDQFADDQRYRSRFEFEAEVTGGLEHPGIVPVYGLGHTPDGRPFYVMRFIKGDSLKDAVRRFHEAEKQPGRDPGRSALELRDLLGRFIDVCDAVAYAHSRRVLHRDLKPGNIMLGKFGETLVVDWGLAKALDRIEPESPIERSELPLKPASGSALEPTLPGSAVGTPAYMSPEQASGQLDQLGPHSDVYCLGATLYHLLTGHAPCEALQVGEVYQKILAGEIPRPRSINPRIAPALEAICLKALALRPRNRYESAEALKADLGSWLADEPVTAWREPLRARARRWARRHRPAVTGAAVALLAGLIGLAVAATIYLQQRQAQTSRLGLALREVNLLRSQAEADPEGDPARWHAALQAVKRAEDLLGPLIDAASQRRVRELGDQVAAAVQAADRDATLLREVVDIRSALADDPGGSASDAAYTKAFGDAGIDIDGLGSDVAAAQIRSRPPGVALALAAALDDWAGRRREARPRDADAWKRLVATARAADPDETRDRLRQLWSQPDRKAQREPLLTLAKEADPRGWPEQSLTRLAIALADAGEPNAAADLLGRAQVEHPGDVWVNYGLARFLEEGHPPRTDEAIRFYSVARALRPETAHSLAHALANRGRGDEAVVVFRDLTRRRYENGEHWLCLARLLKERGDRENSDAALRKAVAARREAIRLKPDDAQAHSNLGHALRSQGKLDEAITEFRTAIRLKPDDTSAHQSLGAVLCDLVHDYVGAEAEFRTAIRLKPDDAEAEFSLGNALYGQGKLEEAIAAYRTAIRLKPDDAEAHYGLGLALDKQGKLDEAIAAYSDAIRLKPDYAEAHCNLGELLQNQGRFREALAEYRRGHELGSKRPGWPYPSAQWVRQAELMVALESRLPAVLRGDDKPKDAGEGIDFADLAYKTKQFVPSARLYTESFRVDPKLAEDMKSGNRYNAACAAALAGAGQGKDKPPLDEKDKAYWRKQALDWLRADLAHWTNQAETGEPQAKALVWQKLQRWKADPDLPSICDEAALKALPEDEQKACRALWAEVDALLDKVRTASPP
jgi:serine/threonine protein kinase/Flp pilus assembly protein TadD